MLSQVLGALVRAAIVVIVVATPSLLLPGTSPEGAQVVVLLGLSLAVFVLFEYGSRYPALLEFRDAPPFNRVRILSLFLTLFCLSIVAAPGATTSTFGLILNALGLLVGRALDFPWSPLRVLLDHLPQSADTVTALQVEIMAGLAVLLTLVSLGVFAVLLRLRHWPNRGSAFNVWVNLPTFDPTTGGDVVKRLLRDARVNFILGFTLPFFFPVVGVLAAHQMQLYVPGSPHAMVWGLSLWMFLPLSLFMRGLAMTRIARMIEARRAQLVAQVEDDSLNRQFA